MSLPGAAWAQQDANLAVTTEMARAAALPDGPSVAEVIGNDVHVRSGPGTNFYHCGKLYRGDRVQVLKSQQGWSCIVPPPGCFSWVAMQYVSINMENPTEGIVTGDNVGVYAGSDYVEPIHSTSKQIVLNRGQNVKLLSEEKDDYYKIAPPEGAYLWVSTQFLQPASSPLGATPMDIVTGPNTPVETPPTPQEIRTESDLLDTYYALTKLVKEERDKPMAQQKYTEIKEKLKVIAENKEGGRAARYADFTLKQVERFELACTVAREVELQSKEREKLNEKIGEARQVRLAQIEDLGRFAVIGKLESTSIYAPAAGQARRYRVLDDSGKTVCYVSPTGAAAGLDLENFVGHKVGLVGEIQPHQPTGRAFVEFSEIVPLD
ncbi:MAG: hypothetical protein RBS72_08370 [Sedimentisphaerales bacterium]|nr:hypothetical protein [Sedimentisphaerales bacterium]HNY77752.1 hypothetical protein [Sedimentisphaerales bacterium]HOC63496.1 hypothetical protein [Sedimentisphaerales bacterium]HOH63927.1 hypothetical protein [Sedimentisphaerales bacterium]HPY49088.1 hypothetical protein [Sedimentisphaerales bacterium]